jgi:spermidine synthase
VCIALPSSAEYAGDDAKAVRAILRNTLGAVFNVVEILPVGRDVFLASDSTIRTDVAAAIAETGVQTVYVNAGYLQDDLVAARSRRMVASLPNSTPINSDAHPVLMLAQMSYWFRFFAPDSWLPALVFVALLLVIIRTDRISFGVLSAGCGGIVLELLVLMIIQVAFGNVYKLIGVLIGVYMAGMSLGACLAGRVRVSARTYGVAQCGLALALLLSPLIQPTLSTNEVVALVFLTVGLFLGSLCAGAIFTLTVRMAVADPVSRGARLYAVDLLGSAIGALLVGPLLLPLLGIEAVANAATCLVIVGALVTLTSPAWRAYAKA